MKQLTSWKNRVLSRVLRYCPGLVRRWAQGREFVQSLEVPWTPLRKPLAESRVALVTTAGVHLRTQPPFDMQNALGDPSFREIPATATAGELTITHDYYDHRDADQDINIVFPLERLKELSEAGEVGQVSPLHLGFMGHVDGELVPVLRHQTAPAAAYLLRQLQTDVVLLFPA